MMHLEIEYCEIWDYLPEATRVVTEVQHLDNVRIVLVPGGGGIFVIKLDGSVIYDKSQFNRFPLRGEILALIP